MYSYAIDYTEKYYSKLAIKLFSVCLVELILPLKQQGNSYIIFRIIAFPVKDY